MSVVIIQVLKACGIAFDKARDQESLVSGDPGFCLKLITSNKISVLNGLTSLQVQEVMYSNLMDIHG